MRQITLEVNDDATDEQIEDWKSLAKSLKYVVFKVPGGVTQEQVQGFMHEGRLVLQRMSITGQTLVEMGQEAVEEGALAARPSRAKPPIHVCDALCHHPVHQTKETINA